MPQTLSKVTVDPSRIGRVSVRVIDQHDADAPAYATANGDTAVSWPDEISATTTYHLATDAEYRVSVKVNGVEVADGNGGELRGAGGHMVIAPALNTVTELAAGLVAQAPLTQAFTPLVAGGQRDATGLWVTSSAALSTSGSLSLVAPGWTWFDRVLVPYDGTITKMGIQVTTAGEAGALIRLGLYREDDSAVGADLSQLGDFSTVAGDSTGAKEVDELAISVAAGQMLRPAVKWDGGGTAPQVIGHTLATTTGSLYQALSGSAAGTVLNLDTSTGEFPAAVAAAETHNLAPRVALWLVPS